MQRRSPEETAAGILGFIGIVFSLPISLALLGYAYSAAMDFLDGYLDYYTFVSIFGAMISSMLLISAIVGLVKLRKGQNLFASYAFASAALCWFAYSTAFVLAEVIEGYSILETAWDIYFWRWEFYLVPSGAPTPIVFSVAAILLFMKVNQKSFPVRFQPQEVPLHNRPAIQPLGSKTCPDCAEFIKVNALKCRFCNYRFA